MGFEVLMEVYKNILEDGILSCVFWKLHILIQQYTLRHCQKKVILIKVLWTK
jgi:hypothetical protein